MHREASLSVRNLRKRYPNGTMALHDVSFGVRPASVHGLVGANGAGKSTLIKILSGAIPATGGDIVWGGERRVWRSPSDALASGIATIHQTVPLAMSLSVRENVFLPSGGAWRNARDERDRLRSLLDRVRYSVDPDAIVGTLTIGERQMVTILQALAADAQLIIMDEPTASLADRERRVVFDVIKRLRGEQGRSILFISHFIDEILELCDEVTTLRDGRVALSASRDQLDEEGIVQSLVGRRIERPRRSEASSSTSAPRLLEARGLSSGDRLKGVDIVVHAGEILGLAGLLGSGRSEILHAIGGADRRAKGTVTVSGRELPRSIRQASRAGVVLVPEDRTGQALFVGESIRWNTSLPRLEEVSTLGVPWPSRERRRAQGVIKTFAIKAGGPETEVGQLSGGNAQKVALSRCLARNVEVVLLDEPTAGIDVGAKDDVWRAMRELTAAGKGIIVVLSDFEELLAVCDRLAVVRAGRIVAERSPTDTNEHELVALASGVEIEDTWHV